jgi:hypothetical protein
MRFDDPAELTRTGRTVARFDDQPHPYRFEVQGCPTPGCHCADGTVVAYEVAPTGPTGRSLRVVVDLHTGLPTEPPTTDLAAEVVRDLPAAAREGALQRLRAQRSRELDGFVLDRVWVGAGGLLPFSHLFRGGLPDDPQYRGLLDRFYTEDGHRWTVQDLYCPRPGCDCKEVTLSFDRDDGASFTAVLDFVDRPPALADFRGGLGFDDAVAVWAGWRRSERADRERFAARYTTLREHLARAAAPPVVRPPAPRAPEPMKPHVGPNTPCPCGSGKKYKRCHGATAVA